jgi:hypothetical protein
VKVKFISEEAAQTCLELTNKRIYHVIGIEADDYRIRNDEGQPYLYPHHLFIVIDDEEPEAWEIELGEEGERYAYPAELNEPGFFEDYFEGKVDAIVTFHRYLQQQSARRQAQ